MRFVFNLQNEKIQGKQHGFADNHRAGLDDRFEIVRRPYSDYRDRFSRLDDYDRYDPVSHWVKFNFVLF